MAYEMRRKINLFPKPGKLPIYSCYLSIAAIQDIPKVDKQQPRYLGPHLRDRKQHSPDDAGYHHQDRHNVGDDLRPHKQQCQHGRDQVCIEINRQACCHVVFLVVASNYAVRHCCDLFHIRLYFSRSEKVSRFFHDLLELNSKRDSGAQYKCRNFDESDYAMAAYANGQRWRKCAYCEYGYTTP